MIRFYFILIFFLISLLAILKAQAYYLWLLAIGVTEFPLIFCRYNSIVAANRLLGRINTRWPVISLGAITLVLFLSPIFRAYIVAGSVKEGYMQKLLTYLLTRIRHLILAIYLNRQKNLPYRSITYMKYQDTSMSLDYYPSLIKGDQPCVIMVHGGSWAGGDSKQLPELNSYLSARGYNVAAINYRLAPKWQTPAPG